MTPSIRSLGLGRHELVVNSRPFFSLGGELNNSSFSSPEHMEAIYPRLKELNVNTAFASVGWESVEPEEGKFNFDVVDKGIAQASKAGIKLALLWFGGHKNGHMSYAPSWVKTSPDRFPRCVTSTVNDYLSVFHSSTIEADARAYAALLSHIRSIDHDETVIMVQVENECGVLGDTRDRSPAANKAFTLVPDSFIATIEQNISTLNSHILSNFPSISSGLKRGRSWEETFGSSAQTDELFMAYHYASYIDKVAAAGKAVYRLPMFTNAALRATRHTARDGGTGGGAAPGIYPSGGPVDTVVDIYHLFAPSLDFVAPDIYFADYETMCKEYTHRDQPLVIPEMRRDEYGALRIWMAYGTYGALSTGPFGIDTLPLDDTAFKRHYELLHQVGPTLLSARRDGLPITGFYFDAVKPGTEDVVPAKTITFGHWDLIIERQPVFGHPAPGYGMIIFTAPDTFLLVGEGYQVTFKDTESKTFTGILRLDELEVTPDGLRKRRRLNGDETHCGKQAVMPSVAPDDGWYPIPINIPSKTRLAECQVYSF